MSRHPKPPSAQEGDNSSTGRKAEPVLPAALIAKLGDWVEGLGNIGSRVITYIVNGVTSLATAIWNKTGLLSCLKDESTSLHCSPRLPWQRVQPP